MGRFGHVFHGWSVGSAEEIREVFSRSRAPVRATGRALFYALLAETEAAGGRDGEVEASRPLVIGASAETGERLFPPRWETAT